MKSGWKLGACNLQGIGWDTAQQLFKRGKADFLFGLRRNFPVVLAV